MRITLPKVTRIESESYSLLRGAECGGAVNIEMFYRKPQLDVVDKSEFDVTIEYPYAGEGVDYVAVEGNSVVMGTHPELYDEDGNTRFRQVNWPAASGTDDKYEQWEDYYDPAKWPGDHANGTATVACGRYFGLAKESHVYCIGAHGIRNKSDGSSISLPECLNIVAEWHRRKRNGRPTVLSMGTINVDVPQYAAVMTAMDSKRAYRKDQMPDGEFQQATRLRWRYNSDRPGFESYTWFLVSSAYVGALRNAIDAGVHVFLPAGNWSNYIAVPESDEDARTIFQYDRPFSTSTRSHIPDEVVVSAALSNQLDNGREVLATYSGRGPGVDFYAPVGLTPASRGPHADLKDVGKDPDALPYVQGASHDSGFYYGQYNGTSAASPMVAGLACCFLSAMPHLTPAQLKTAMKSAATTGRVHVHDDLEDFPDWENVMCSNPLFPYYPFGGGIVKC